MKQTIVLCILLAVIILFSTGCAGVKPPPVTISQVVAMSQAGVPEDQIIDMMRQSRTAYPLSASQLAELRQEGVPDGVINYMQRTYLALARREQEYQDWMWYPYGSEGFFYGVPPYGWP